MDITRVMMIIQYVAILILFAELVYALCQKASEMQKHVIALTIATILMFVGYIIETNSTNQAEAMAGITLAYLGKPFVMISSFLFISSFYDIRIGKKLTVGLVFFGAIFPALVFTNNYHHLYYKTVAFNDAKRYTPLIITRGPLYYLYVIASVVFFIACVYVIINGYKRSNFKYKKSLAVYSVLMVVSGIVGYAVYLSGLSNEYDATMLGVFFGSIFLSLIFMKCKVFDPLSVAKDYALEDSSLGLLVFDEGDEIVYQNESMTKLLTQIPIAYLKNLTDANSVYTSNDKTYSILKKNLVVDGVSMGTSIEISDITESYNYQTILEANVKERTDKIEAIQRTIIASVANIVEARSVETGEHIKRTSNFTGLIARELQNEGLFLDLLTDEYINNLIDAAPLHDIGKIAVPDSILLKPGKLTDEEFEQMKIHTTVGVEIIENSMRGLESDEYITMAQEIAHYHHEAVDGSGYPCGLKGDEIPLSAKIVSVADCYDALISERSYKAAFTKEEALEYISGRIGIQYDKQVVEAFVKALNEQ